MPSLGQVQAAAAGGDTGKPGLPVSAGSTLRPRNYARWRAGSLAAVYLLMGLHIAHWKIAGRTLAPLELNEVMYTLELGIVTAGFIFMAAAVLSVAIFGRFFCSWGCHILALEDLCAWLLKKIRIRPRPVRSRLLLLAGPAAMFYMFIWPQLTRVLDGRPLPPLRVVAGADSWASFTTADFWRNLPGPGVALLTFAVCGFAIVYLLGSRSFCKYACPYGALFALADRVAPGQLLAAGDCSRCGLCTAACQSGIRVHEELTVFGKVVSPSCLKDLDCVRACPDNAIRYGFGKPAGFLSWKRGRPDGRRPPRSDFTWPEELLMAAVFVASVLVLRGLYGLAPFLLTLGAGTILAYGAVLAVRLVRPGVPNVRLNQFQLKRSGCLSRSGIGFAVLAAAALAGMLHSAFIRYHEHQGHRAYDQVVRTAMTGRLDMRSPALRAAVRHLSVCHRWGLYRPLVLDRRLATLHLLADRPGRADRYLQRVQRRDEATAHELVANVRASRGELDAAAAAYRAAIKADPDRFATRLSLAEILAGRGDLAGAAAQLEAAVAIEPDSARARYNLAVLLGRLGREEEAIHHYRVAAQYAPDDPEIPNNLGFLLARRGATAAAAEQFRRSLELDRAYAHAHFNLGRLLHRQGRTAEAEASLRRAAELDPLYARLLRGQQEAASLR